MTSQKRIQLLAILLFLSLGLNCFAFGNMAGQWSVGPTDTMKKDRALRDSLSATDKQVLQETIETYRDDMLRLHAQLVEARENVRRTIRAEKFDSAAFEKAFTTAKDIEKSAMKVGRMARSKAMEKMSTEGRATLTNITRLGFLSKARDVRADCLVR